MKNFSIQIGDERGKLKDQDKKKFSRLFGKLLIAKSLLEKETATGTWLKVFTHHWVKNRDKKAETQVVLTFLLVLILIGRPSFYLVAPVGLKVGLAIGEVVSTGKNITFGLLELF